MSASKALAVAVAIAPFASAQGPGNGVAKTTYTASQPWVGMSCK